MGEGGGGRARGGERPMGTGREGVQGTKWREADRRRPLRTAIHSDVMSSPPPPLPCPLPRAPYNNSAPLAPPPLPPFTRSGQFSFRPPADHIFSLAPSPQISVDEMFSSAPLAPLETQHRRGRGGGGGLDPLPKKEYHWHISRHPLVVACHGLCCATPRRIALLAVPTRALPTHPPPSPTDCLQRAFRNEPKADPALVGRPRPRASRSLVQGLGASQWVFRGWSLTRAPRVGVCGRGSVSQLAGGGVSLRRRGAVVRGMRSPVRAQGGDRPRALLWTVPPPAAHGRRLEADHSAQGPGGGTRGRFWDPVAPGPRGAPPPPPPQATVKWPVAQAKN